MRGCDGWCSTRIEGREGAMNDLMLQGVCISGEDLLK